MPILVREIAPKSDGTSGIAVSELGVLHAQNHHIIIHCGFCCAGCSLLCQESWVLVFCLFLFLVVNPNFKNIALIVVRVSAGVRLSIVVVRISVLRIAVPFVFVVFLVFVVLKRMVVVLLTLEIIII
jgi:hypothetical protein